MTKKIMAFLATWLCFTPTFSQISGTISGTVLDKSLQPVFTALVVLHRQPGDTVIRTAQTDTAGRFLLTPINAGTYYLEIIAAGYPDYRGQPIVLDSLHPLQEISPVYLTSGTGKLQEVQVTAKKSLVIHKADRTVLQVDALLSAAGSTALEVLAKAPGVQVDQNGLISLNGKQGVIIFIDDKPTYLSGGDLADYLRSLPASVLDQIELMSNPPAQYDAAGSAGIINIRMKKGRAKGLDGGLTLSLGQGQMTRSNNSAYINYRRNKLNIFANGSYNLNNSFTDLDLNRVYRNTDYTPAAYFEQNSYFKRHGNTFALNAGADYSISKRTTAGIVLNGMTRASTQYNDNTSHLLNGDRLPDSTIVANNKDVIHFNNGNVNLNYRTRFNEEGHTLSADADYLSYHNKTEQEYRNTGYLPDNSIHSQDLLTGYLPADIRIYSLKADYSRPLPGKLKLGAGAKYSNVKTDNEADYRTTSNGITRPDYDKSNHFLYREQIGAAYLNLNRDIRRLSVQAGLRLEHTNSNGHQLGNAQKRDSASSRDYTNLFPTLYLSYTFDSLATHRIGLNYGRRIDRPYYQDLNPFLYPMDKFTYYTGNPFLKPSFTQAVELSHTYKNRLTTTLSYSKSRDDVNETIAIENGIYYSKPGNIGSKTVKSISVDGTLDPAKWLNIHAYSEYTQISARSDFYNGTLNTSGTFWFINGSIRLNAGKGWDAELSGDYRTRVYDAQFITAAFGQASITIQKKLSGVSTIRLGFNDIFYSRVIHGTITNLVLADAGWVNKGDSRNVTFSYTYRFGKPAGQQKRHETSGADEEKNRVKN